MDDGAGGWAARGASGDDGALSGEELEFLQGSHIDLAEFNVVVVR